MDTLIERLIKALDAARAVDDMPIQHLSMFLHAVLMDDRGGATVKQLGDKAGRTSASATRNVQALSDMNHNGRPGLGLITSKVDPGDSRRKQIHLTKKGRDLAKAILDAMADAPPPPATKPEEPAPKRKSRKPPPAKGSQASIFDIIGDSK